MQNRTLTKKTRKDPVMKESFWFKFKVMFFLLCKEIGRDITEFVDKFLTTVFKAGLIGLMLYLAYTAVVMNRDKTIVLETPKFTEPIVTNWQPEVEFVTIAPVERIGDLEIGQVTVRRTDNNFSLPVLVIPFHEVSVRTKVKIIEIENVTDFPFRRSLIMLKPTESERKENL